MKASDFILTDIISRTCHSSNINSEVSREQPLISELLSKNWPPQIGTANLVKNKDQQYFKRSNKDIFDSIPKQNRTLGTSRIQDSKIDRTVFVGNIGLNVVEKDLLKKLELTRADIESIRFRSLPVHPKFSHNRKLGAILEGFSCKSDSKNAYIVLKDSSKVPELVKKFTGIILAGHTMRLSPAYIVDNFNIFDRKRTIFVGNLPSLCSEDELRQFVMQNIGTNCVDAVRIVRSKITGKTKGFGFILFNDRKFVNIALKKLQGSLFVQNSLNIMKALPKDQVVDNMNNSSRIKYIYYVKSYVNYFVYKL
ncbi:RNA recognition motif. family protein [Cryptosporidium muris RN66]|uniref:RNA recognition motif. family protein n=1 Tax=Cryptosporidium muris (strain RN66) TaxID=441375 RepID=B6AIS3_CRYMR|nr:RNA recognition motif. family protein [Cryptosporidium muris RN66]EEA08114.1 RNA recognition motif. family protein [Cryptosporidium muris RN66]|eukprot:XP_002142463.1 RNA recognition motif. family protein [Cryptosporidium muris RN66]